MIRLLTTYAIDNEFPDLRAKGNGLAAIYSGIKSLKINVKLKHKHFSVVSVPAIFPAEIIPTGLVIYIGQREEQFP